MYVKMHITELKHYMPIEKWDPVWLSRTGFMRDEIIINCYFAYIIRQYHTVSTQFRTTSKCYSLIHYPFQNHNIKMIAMSPK